MPKNQFLIVLQFLILHSLIIVAERIEKEEEEDGGEEKQHKGDDGQGTTTTGHFRVGFGNDQHWAGAGVFWQWGRGLIIKRQLGELSPSIILKNLKVL